MKRLFILIFLFLPLGLMAQPYQHSAGVRAGYTSGLSYKGFFLHSMNAIELNVGYNRHGLNISGLFDYHMELFGDEQWHAYFGGGPFAGEWDEEFSLGIVAVAGVEYQLRKTPLIFGLDWRPMLNAYRNFDYDLVDFGLNIRYRFSSRY